MCECEGKSNKHKKNDRIGYIRHRECSSHSKVPKVDRKRVFTKVGLRATVLVCAKPQCRKHS